MQVKTGMQSSRSDFIKWLFIAAVLAMGVYANYAYIQVAAPLRVAGWIILLLMLAGVAALTEQGRNAVEFAREARTELRKVVWPSRQETTQTAIIVSVMVLITALILWGVDGVLLWAVGLITQ